MTVVTPGGPCLTQTQINRNEQQARFEEKQEAKRAEAPNNPYGATPPETTLGPNAPTGVEKTDTSQQAQKSYGAPGGGQLVDISV